MMGSRDSSRRSLMSDKHFEGWNDSGSEHYVLNRKKVMWHVIVLPTLQTVPFQIGPCSSSDTPPWYYDVTYLE
jgi:hypothetical protein